LFERTRARDDAPLVSKNQLAIISNNSLNKERAIIFRGVMIAGLSCEFHHAQNVLVVHTFRC